MSGTKGKAFDVGLFRRVMQFVRPYRRLFWITFALTIFLSLVAVVRPVLMAKMVDNYAVKGDLNGLYMMMAIVVGLLVVEGIVQFYHCLLYTSPSPRDRTRSRMPSSA